MTASELDRKLLYYGYSDVTEFLRNSPLNRYIYKQMLILKEQDCIRTPMVTLFNEIYYQCVRADFDINPGENLSSRYIRESEQWLNSKPAATLVFLFVWLMFKRKRTLTFNEECFLEHLTPLVLSSDSRQRAEEMLWTMEENDIKVPDRFAPMIYPAVGIPTQAPNEASPLMQSFSDAMARILADDETPPSNNAWMDLTDNYSYPLIEKYVKLYPDTSNRLYVLDRIEESVPKRLRKKHQDFFKGLRIHIETGQVVYKSLSDEEIGKNTDWYDVTSFGVSESLNPYTNELQNLADQYKQERDEAKRQCEDQKNYYEMELSRLESEYLQKIRELEARLDTVSVIPQEGQQADGDSSNQEMSFTVLEMAEFVKKQFDRTGGADFTNMFYQLARKYNHLDEDICRIVDGIVPAILQRNALHQTLEFHDTDMVNINPQNVHNHGKEGE